MKQPTILIILFLVLVLGGYYLWQSADIKDSSPTTIIDTSDKIHPDLYEGASGTWDPQMQVLPFDLVPETQLTLKWTPPEAAYNHFVITISQADGTLIRKESGEHDRTSLDPDGLEPGVEYVFALQACLSPTCEQWLIAQSEYRGSTTQPDESTSYEDVIVK